MTKIQYIRGQKIPYQQGEKVEGFWAGELMTDGKYTVEFPMSAMKGGVCQGELILTNQHLYFELKNFVFTALNHRETVSGFLKIPFALLREVQTSNKVTLAMEDQQRFSFKIPVGMEKVAGVLKGNLKETPTLLPVPVYEDETAPATCPCCTYKMRIARWKHTKIACIACQRTLEIKDGKIISPSPDEKVQVSCPACQTTLEIPAFKTKEVQCGQCQASFTANNGQLQYQNQTRESLDFTYQDFIVRQEFLLNGDHFVMDIDISSHLYQYFHEKEQEFRHANPYLGQPLVVYYQTFFGFYWKDPNEIELLERVLRSLENLVHKSGGHYLVEEMLVAYIQGAIEYDYSKVGNKDGKTNHPYETICSAKGVCRDTAILMIKLLNLLGYDAVMIIFPGANHAGVGLRVPDGQGSYRDHRGVEYCYIETTGYWRIGDLPDEYSGTMYLQEQTPLFVYSQGNGHQSFRQIVEYRRQREPVISRWWDRLFG